MCTPELTFPLMKLADATKARVKTFSVSRGCKECGSNRRMIAVSTIMCYDCCGAYGDPGSKGSVAAELGNHNRDVQAAIAKRSNFAVVVSKGMSTF